jgi:hypothetical protein
MQLIEKDIFTIEKGLIGHQVNCQKTMGRGFVLPLIAKWPQVKEDYLRFQPVLGEVLYSRVEKNIIVASMYGQDRYGTDKRYTDYEALKSCLFKLSELGARLNLPIYLPYKIGCGNGGGEWSEVSKIIYYCCNNAIICKHEA